MDDSLGLFRRESRCHTGSRVILHVLDNIRLLLVRSECLNGGSLSITHGSGALVCSSSGTHGLSVEFERSIAGNVFVVLARFFTRARTSSGSTIGCALRACSTDSGTVASMAEAASVVFARFSSSATTDSQLSGLKPTATSRESCALHFELISRALFSKILNGHSLSSRSGDGSDHGEFSRSSSIDDG
jgi:hypothetical protein